MADDRVTIDSTSLLDDTGERRIEFDGEASGERYRFAVQYDVLQALSGQVPDDDATILFEDFADEIEAAASDALARDPDQDIVMVSENDLG